MSGATKSRRPLVLLALTNLVLLGALLQVHQQSQLIARLSASLDQATEAMTREGEAMDHLMDADARLKRVCLGKSTVWR